ncbi:hypothetical protein JYU34_012422 [Plutella xylostella]|uniref:BRCA1-associated ATM activator 1 n=1 Tax=Plutella xylostella TaxID=51655 RepID=A0ABQ7QCB5_PLUXY|nr:hypothetical protein JYU34_012422 [Plutella xylostella]
MSVIDPGNIANKIKLLFQKIADPNYILDNYYADGLINKISTKEDPDIIALEKLTLLSDLLIQALEKIDEVHITVQVFLVRLCSLVFCHELNFVKIISTTTADQFKKALNEINLPDKKPSVKVAYLELAHAFIKHPTGVQWLIRTSSWENIIRLTSGNQSVFVLRQTYKFASIFLWQLNDLGDEDTIKKVLDIVLQPILSNNFINVLSVTAEDEAQHSRVLIPMMHTLMDLFTQCSRLKRPTLLMNVLLNHYKITNHLVIMKDRIAHEKDINFLAAKLLFWLSIARTLLDRPLDKEEVVQGFHVVDVAVTYFNLMTENINKRCPTMILDISNACNVIWSQMWGIKGPKYSEDLISKGIILEQQFILLQLVPIITYMKTSAMKNDPNKMIDKELDDFVGKCMDLGCEHTSRTAYALRDVMKTMDPLAVALQSVKRLSCLKSSLNDVQANLIFQTLFYCLREYDPADEYGEWKPEELYELSLERSMVMTYVMDTILLLLNNFKIHWSESIEVICLYTIVQSVLKRQNLSPKFVVAALKVQTFTIKNFLPPNLSLLMEATSGSSLSDIGQRLHRRLLDLNWEVRDSALELLQVCTEISFMKFPPMQKQIVDNNLINVAAAIALNDHQFYAQASALKCLAAATKVNCFWEKLKSEYPNIEDRLIIILKENQEGLVRQEAVNVLCEIYQNLKLSPAFTDTLLNHMISTALTDFHWEVQIAALKFWRVVIHRQFSEQGMLDGTFPPVTFSKETRKIVTLNTEECGRRLVKAMDALSSLGCLTVLLKLLQDDVETEIVKTSLAISEEMLDILHKYNALEFLNESDTQNMNNITIEVTEDAKPEKGQDAYPRTAPKSSDDIIEGILNSDDMNLLSNIYQQHLSLQPVENDTGAVPEPKVKVLRFVTPSTFVKYLKSKNFKAIIEQRRQWNDGIRSLSSLLDDVLGIYEISEGEDYNTMDCY